MRRYLESDRVDERFYLAGECAPAGMYQEVTTGRTVSLDGEDRLPATLDGHVACYRRIACTWRQIKGGMADQKASLPAGVRFAQGAGDLPAAHVSSASDLGKVTGQS